jgi:hypothetical protein
MQHQGSSGFRSSRREAAVAIGIWLVMLIYSISYCALNGYAKTDANLKFIFGFPTWVFWGVVVPWVVCIGITAWFAFAFVEDCDLDPLDRDTG